jgi:hypothetical protein
MKANSRTERSLGPSMMSDLRLETPVPANVDAEADGAPIRHRYPSDRRRFHAAPCRDGWPARHPAQSRGRRPRRRSRSRPRLAPAAAGLLALARERLPIGGRDDDSRAWSMALGSPTLAVGVAGACQPLTVRRNDGTTDLECRFSSVNAPFLARENFKVAPGNGRVRDERAPSPPDRPPAQIPWRLCCAP